MKAGYRVSIFRNGVLYDRQWIDPAKWTDPAGFNITAYVRNMLAHGFGIDVEYVECCG